RISSLSNSPWMRSAPQSRLFAAISLIKTILARALAFSNELSICASRIRGRAHDASKGWSPAGQGGWPVSMCGPSWSEAPGETDPSCGRRVISPVDEGEQLLS
ncbi:MAG: hypothetical protein M3Y76_06660, partial [Chloroflexota bacterium]|nr:hypothetical protein [Chloroflexota bacterium]